MSTAAMPVYKWNTLNWRAIEKSVFKLQKRSYPQMGEIIEKDHILSLAHGGLDILSNRQLLHGHCHVQKTATCETQKAEVFMSTNQLAEEPGAEKSASPVVKAGGQR
jgi:hypothetical protein